MTRARAVTTVGAATLMLVACQLISGVDDFSVVQNSGDGAAGIDSASDGSAGSSLGGAAGKAGQAGSGGGGASGGSAGASSGGSAGVGAGGSAGASECDVQFPLAHWNAENNFDDAGGKYDTSLQGVGGPRYKSSIHGLAFDFDGTWWLEVQSDDFALDGGYTIAAWVQVAVAQPDAWRAIISREDPTVTTNEVRQRTFGLFLSNNGGCTGPGVPQASHLNAEVCGFTHIVDSSWHHLTAIFDGSFLSLYVDKSGKSLGVPAPVSTPNQVVKIGASTDWRFVGLIDEVRIWGCALRPTDISTLVDQ